MYHFNREAEVVSIAQQEYKQYYPHTGWVEHNPVEIWLSQSSVITQALKQANITSAQLDAVGITNQREATMLWDKKSGKPIYNAIVWQGRRTADYCQQLKQAGLENLIPEKYRLIVRFLFFSQ